MLSKIDCGDKLRQLIAAVQGLSRRRQAMCIGAASAMLLGLGLLAVLVLYPQPVAAPPVPPAAQHTAEPQAAEEYAVSSEGAGSQPAAAVSSRTELTDTLDGKAAEVSPVGTWEYDLLHGDWRFKQR